MGISRPPVVVCFVLCTYPLLWDSVPWLSIKEQLVVCRCIAFFYFGLYVTNTVNIGGIMSGNSLTYEDGNRGLRNLFVAASAMNFTFPFVNMGLWTLETTANLKLCQLWQLQYPAIYGFIAVPLFYMATSLVVLVCSASSYPGGFFAVQVTAAALVLCMAVFHLCALALLNFHSALGLPERYEPLAAHPGTKPLARDPQQPHTHTLSNGGPLSRRFLEQERQMTERVHQREGLVQKTVTQLTCQSTDPGIAVAAMDFGDSLRSWGSLSSMERDIASVLAIGIVALTLLDAIAGWLYFAITLRLPPGPESCPR